MSSSPAAPEAAPTPHALPPHPEASLGKEVRESALLLGLSFGVTAGLTVALQAVLSVVS